MGRIWFAWFLFPIPVANEIWPNFRSPLEWDVFAVSTYFTVSLLFWYMGMIPDLATIRDRCKTRFRKVCYGVMSQGWRGSNRNWNNYEMSYLILAGLSTPLVLSVHSIISFDFAVANLPGWHTTIFPPYFVVGAIFSGFGMVLTLVIPLRAVFGLHDILTQRHIDAICKITLGTGTIVGYAYCSELFIAWYGGNPFESFAFENRTMGPYWWAYMFMFGCNVITPQFFWFAKVRQNILLVWILSLVVNVGMWFERFVIVVTTLANEYLPANWDYFTPTWVDIGTYVGTMGIFMVLWLLFCRFLPCMAIGEIKACTIEANPHPDHWWAKEVGDINRKPKSN